MAKNQEKLSDALAEKYGVPHGEVDGVINSFLEDTYGPTIKTSQAIDFNEVVVLLFIGRKDCAICQRSEPILEIFLSPRHMDLKLVKLDYSQPAGLLYHIIHGQESGMLPLIAFIIFNAIF